jgi:hypothetical protein
MEDIGADLPTNARRGSFYRDDEILLCLNMAQDMLVDYILESQDSHLLGFLMCKVPYVKANPAFPVNFAYAAEGYVLDGAGIPYRAEILLGANAIPYLYDTVSSTTIGLINDDLYYNTTQWYDFKIYYYEYPPAIVTSGDNIAFQDDMYLGVICELGATVLGFKEPQTQREFKNKMVARANREGVNVDETSFNTILEYSKYLLKLLMGGK